LPGIASELGERGSQRMFGRLIARAGDAQGERELTGAVVERGHRAWSQADALSQLSGVLAEATDDYQSLTNAVAKLAGEYLASSSVLRVFDDSHLALEVVAWHDEFPERLVPIAKALTATRLSRDDPHPAARVYQEGIAAHYSGDAIAEASREIDPDNPQLLTDQGVSSVLWVPLRASGSVIGTLALFRFANGKNRVHGPRDLEFAQELADRAALGIQNARLVLRLRNELADRMQAEQSTRLSLELLKESDAKRRALLADLVSAQEEERQLIASDVHDDSLQAMASVGLSLDRLYRRLSDTEYAEVVAELREDVDGAVARLRDLLFQLNPVTLEREGLARAFEAILTRYFVIDGIACSVNSTLTLDPEQGIRFILYRIGQEALINVRKHASATRITVTMSRRDGGFLVSVADDGVGFDTGEAGAASLPGHMGLRSMRRRAEGAGGRLQVDSTPGAGTTVQGWIPSRLGDFPGGRDG
jgi:signal transduction histidine kinase